jgi:hypothetical protein
LFSPYDIVQKISSGSHGDSASSFDEIVKAVKSRLQATIYDAGRNRVGHANSDTRLSDGKVLEGRVTPDITILSSAACYSDELDPKESPIEWFDWKSHGKPFVGDGVWKSARV